MTETPLILKALLAPPERATVEKAADVLTDVLSRADKAAWRVQCVSADNLTQLTDQSDLSVLIVSLLDEVATLGTPWAVVEARLRDRYEALANDGRWIVFICTVLRHVPRDAPDRQAKLIRIRRLNALVAELSRELGIFVVDIDRELANIGARELATDYNLSGPFAPEAAAKAICMSLLLMGLDDFVPMKLQETARALLASMPVLTRSEDELAEDELAVIRPGVNAQTVRHGKRRQIVAAISSDDESGQIKTLIRRLLRGQTTPVEAAAVVIKAIRNKGLGHAAGVLMSTIKSKFSLSASEKMPVAK